MKKHKNKIKQVGIIGYGRFGKLASTLTPKNTHVLIYDKKNGNPASGQSSLREVCGCDILILSVPLSAYNEILPEIAKFITPEQLIVDVCSVKLIPEKLIDQYLPNHESVLITHPLFGPQSYRQEADNNRLIVTKQRGQLADELLEYCTGTLGLKVTRMSADEHDRIMARVHALTFFVARGLAELDLPEEKFITPSYEKILNLVNFNESHSEELFKTIQVGNPYAKEMRRKVIDAFSTLDHSIEKTEQQT